MLIAAGAPVDGADLVGLMLLGVAALIGRTDAALVLLDHGSDPNVRPPDGERPLARAPGGARGKY